MKKENDIWKKLDKSVKEVDAPDHIFSRIQAKLEQAAETASPKFVWSLSVASVLVLCFNIFIAFQSINTSSEKASPALNDSMNLFPDQQLYHD